jgi:hypothetical protein
LQDIQGLLRGERESDYIFLDQLMNVLIEQYSAIQAVSGALPAADPVCPSLPPEEKKIASTEQAGPIPSHDPVETHDLSFLEPAIGRILSSDSPEPSMAPAEPPQASLEESTRLRDAGESYDAGFGEMWSISPELQYLLDTPLVSPNAEAASADGLSFEAAPMVQIPSEESCPIIPESPEEFTEPAQKESDAKTETGNKTKLPEADTRETTNPTPEAKSSPAVSLPDQEKVNPPAAALNPAATPETKVAENSNQAAQSPSIYKPGSAARYGKFRRPTYRSAAALLSVLVLAAAGYIFRGTDAVKSLTNLWNSYGPNSDAISNAFASLRGQKAKDTTTDGPAEDSKPSPASTTAKRAVPSSGEAQQKSPDAKNGIAAMQPPPESVARIAALIDSGKLQTAKTELDKLQRAYPNAPQVYALRKRWQAKVTVKESSENLEKARKEEERLTAARRQREEEWNRQLAALFSRGKYVEASNALNQWLGEDPGSEGAQEYSGKLSEIQRNLKTYASSMSENKYQDALSAIGAVEKLNPGDANLAELRRQVEARKAAAKAVLTVYRLGSKATLSLDGRPIGNDGEIENESIPIGNHTLAVETGGNLIASKKQEFFEGQRAAFVYDLAKQSLRPMADSDRDLLSQRKTMEEVRSFEVEHEHGAFRGSCHGTLTIDYLDVAYKPSSGYHGFRIPFKQLKISVEGKSVHLLNASDNKQLQTFKFREPQVAGKFAQSWDELKAFAR